MKDYSSMCEWCGDELSGEEEFAAICEACGNWEREREIRWELMEERKNDK